MSLLVKDAVNMAIKQMEDCSVPDAKHDAEALFCYLMKIPADKFFRWWSDVIDDRTIGQYMDLVAVRAGRVPLQHITGVQNFMGYNIEIAKEVLIPRQDTETVAKKAGELLESIRGDEVLDLCCGSGNIGVYLAKSKNAKVTFIDASHEACNLTKKNTSKYGVKAGVLEGDLFEPLKPSKKYDVIVSNPPYIRTGALDELMPEVKDNEPLDALDGGYDGLDFYRRIVEGAPAHLREGAYLILEIGADQARDVSGLIEDTGRFMDIETGKDLAGNDRFVCAMLISQKILKQRAKDETRRAKEEAKRAALQAKADEKQAKADAKAEAARAKEEAKTARKAAKKGE